MNAISKWTIGLALLAGAAHGQVPSTNDTSDAHGNTGMGTNALGGPNAVHLSGINNTASGDAALFQNTTGGFNLAGGYGALECNTTGSQTTAVGSAALTLTTTGG
ncbi:MAG: hypothetical protein ABSH33_22845, partial [Steroidobacteraceae bacterium]